jgi:tetratricopeptide (TPR) repeat protein
LSNLEGEAAYWLVQENQPEEALKMGRLSAESYSAMGLLGLAEALEANKKFDEALRVYRAIAQRYDSSAWNLIDFLFRMNASDEDITREIKQLLETHKTMKVSAAKSIVEGFRTQGDHLTMLESLLQTDLSIVKPQDRIPLLLDVSIYSRRFDKAIRYATDLVQQNRRLDIVQTLEVYVAMTLLGQPGEAKKCIDELKNYPKDRWLYPHVRYLQGKFTAEQMLAGCDVELDRAYAYWLIGVRAESEKDYPSAFKAYEKASRCCTSYLPRRLGKYWPQMIQAKTVSTTLPAATQPLTTTRATSNRQ